MTTESTITRTLNIRFIDARKLATAAKLNLGITGYPSEGQQELLVTEATRIFHDEMSSTERAKFLSDNMKFLSAKCPSCHKNSSRSHSSVSNASVSAGDDSSVDIKAHDASWKMSPLALQKRLQPPKKRVTMAAQSA